MKLRQCIGMLAAVVGAVFASSAIGGESAAAKTYPQVHVYQARESGIFVNAYLVETLHGVVAIDATLTQSDSKALRVQLDSLGKPLIAVLLTHGHPDHYNGVGNLLSGDRVPVVSTSGVAAVIKRDDARKEAQWKPVFKDEWPAPRTFPNRTLADEETLRLDGVAFTVYDLGLGESDADSVWIATSTDGVTKIKLAFIGDVVLQGVHAYLSDGHSGQWLRNIERVRKIVAGAKRLYPGHGDSGDETLLDEQRDYLLAYRRNVAAIAAGKPQVTEPEKEQLEVRMLAYRNTERLRFLIKLGADPVAAELAHAGRE